MRLTPEGVNTILHSVHSTKATRFDQRRNTHLTGLPTRFTTIRTMIMDVEDMIGRKGVKTIAESTYTFNLCYCLVQLLISNQHGRSRMDLEQYQRYEHRKDGSTSNRRQWYAQPEPQNSETPTRKITYRLRHCHCIQTPSENDNQVASMC